MIANSVIKLKNTIRICLLIICGLFLGINIYITNSHKVIGNELPMPFGFGAAVILSGSMEPQLSVNDLIIVKPEDSYVVGDIVVYQDKSILIVHRIVDIDENTITTKGDANYSSDKPIDISAIKGEVIYTIPYIGIIVNYLKSPVGIVITILMSIFLIEYPNNQKKKTDIQYKQKLIEEIQQLKSEIRSDIHDS